MALFVGGPYDAMDIDQGLLNKFGCLMPFPAEGQNRLFVLMPPREKWDLLCRGEITKSEAGGPLLPYERVFAPGGAEFRFSESGQFEEALAGKPDTTWAKMRETISHEEKLGEKLENRLSEHLNSTQFSVIPPGTLGAGMGYTQSHETSCIFDKEKGLLVITGTVRLEVSRTDREA